LSEIARLREISFYDFGDIFRYSRRDESGS